MSRSDSRCLLLLALLAASLTSVACRSVKVPATGDDLGSGAPNAAPAPVALPDPLANVVPTDAPPSLDRVCGSCHMLPPADAYRRADWEWVFDYMSVLLGRTDPGDEGSGTPSRGRQLAGEYRFVDPARPRVEVTDDEWNEVLAYYRSNAPDNFFGFDLRIPPLLEQTLALVPESLPSAIATTSIYIDEERRQVVAGVVAGMDGLTNLDTRVFVFDDRLRQVASGPVPGPVVSIASAEQGWYGVQIGSLVATQETNGSLLGLTIDGTTVDSAVLLDALHRPTHLQRTVRDGTEQLYIAEFGHLSGSFTRLDSTPEGFERSSLRPRSGTIMSALADVDGDGVDELLALAAQEHEQLIAWEPDGAAWVAPRVLLQNHPSFGSAAFAVGDFDGSGMPEIVIANGDNGDHPDEPPKPYSGIHVYQYRDGAYVERHFAQLLGALGLTTGDFNNDGRLDFATFAFHIQPDLGPVRRVLIGINNGAFDFSIFSIPLDVATRFCSIDAGDIDGDGDSDLALGACSNPPEPPAEPPIILLLNQYSIE